MHNAGRPPAPPHRRNPPASTGSDPRAAATPPHPPRRFGYFFTVLRSSPYFAGLLGSAVVYGAQRRQLAAEQLPTSAVPAHGAGAAMPRPPSDSGSSSGKSVGSGGNAAEEAAGKPGVTVLAVTAAAATGPDEGLALDIPAREPAGRAARAARWLAGLPWRRVLRLMLDWGAVMLGCTLAYTGVGANRQAQAAGLPHRSAGQAAGGYTLAARWHCMHTLLAACRPRAKVRKDCFHPTNPPPFPPLAGGWQPGRPSSARCCSSLGAAPLAGRWL